MTSCSFRGLIRAAENVWVIVNMEGKLLHVSA